MEHSAEDIRDLRTRLLKKYGEDVARELEAIDPTFADPIVVIIALQTDADGHPSAISMVGNVDTESIPKVLHLAADSKVIATKQAFEKGH